MEQESVEQRVYKCISECLAVPSDGLTLSSQIGDFPEWDSLGHIRIYFALQEKFSITIPLEIAGDVRSIDDWLRIVKKSSSEHNG